MKKSLIIAALAMLAAACTSVTTTRVGEKSIVHVTEYQVMLLGDEGASVNKCVKTLGEKGATRIVTQHRVCSA